MAYEEQLKLADEANIAGNYAEAERIANEVLASLPNPTQTLSEREGFEESSSSSSFPFEEGWDEVLIRANALLVLAESARLQGAIPQAHVHAEAALTLAHEHNYPAIKAKAWTLIGRVYRALGSYDKALEYYGQALALNEEIGDASGIAINIGGIGLVYLNLGDYNRSLDYLYRALVLAEEMNNTYGIAINTNSIGAVFHNIGDYSRTLDYYHRSLILAEKMNSKEGIATNLGNIGNVYKLLGDYTRSLDYYLRALTLSEEMNSKEGMAFNLGNIGLLHNLLGDYTLSLDYLYQSLSLNEEMNNKEGIARDIGNIGVVHTLLGNTSRSLDYFHHALAFNEEMNSKDGIAINLGNIGGLYSNENFDGYDVTTAETFLLKAIALSKEIGAKKNLFELHKILADVYEKQDRVAEALAHYKKYHTIGTEVQSEETKKHAEVLDYERKQSEREKQLAIERTKHEATEQLLHNVLPPSIAHRMIKGESLIAEKLVNVSVLFADIVNFTNLSQRITAEELVAGLDRIFSEFDALAEKYGLEKIKTIGDAYMVVSGAPVPRADHAEAMAQFALEIMESMKQFTSISTGEPIQIRIGIHSGEVVAGVIGKKKFAYDLWGDAVNTASRMESHGEPGRIHVSEDFKIALVGTSRDLCSNNLFHFHERGEIEIKGKGIMKTYFLEKEK